MNIRTFFIGHELPWARFHPRRWQTVQILLDDGRHIRTVGVNGASFDDGREGHLGLGSCSGMAKGTRRVRE